MMKHALALASAVFFWMPIASLLILIFPFGGLSTWFGALVPTCMISFTGSILLLIGARLDSSRFYWLIPFCLMTFAVLAAGVAIFFLFFFGIVSGRNERDIPGDAPLDARSLLRSGIFIFTHTRHSPVSIDLHGNICQRVLCFDNFFFIHRGLPSHARAAVSLLDVRDADHRRMLSGMCIFIPEKRTSRL